MKKLTFLIHNGEYEGFLEHLRSLGVVHVIQKQQGAIQDSALQDDINLLARYKSAMKVLEPLLGQQIAAPESPANHFVFDTADKVIERFDILEAEKLVQEQTLQLLERDRAQLLPWGDFEPAALERLAGAGYKIRLYTCPLRAFQEEWVAKYSVVEIDSDKQKINFATVTHTDVVPDIDAELVNLPAMSLSAVEKDIAKTKAIIEANPGKLAQLAAVGVPVLNEGIKNLENRINFSSVKLTGERLAADSLVLLEGWAPAADVDEISRQMDVKGVFFDVEDPEPGDDIPIKLKNNRFARLFEPLTEMYSLPNYSELDPTAAFAPFFMLFFGLCMGDGGYGLIIFLACTFAKKKLPALKDFMALGQWLGISTIIVGLLTGMVFGISLDTVAWPWLAGVKDKFITDNNYNVMGYSPMMVVAVCVGILQILFGMGFKIVRITIQLGLKYALSEIGWLVLLLDMIVMLLLKFAGVDMPQFATNTIYGIACACGVLILFFNSPGKNPFLNLGSGLWGTYNMVSGLLGDVLSYIRLFALGLAGGILGGVFNQLAFQAGGALPVWVGWLPTALILLLGHGLNLFLCIISALVHPIRLTFVEFFKNAGFEGGGKAYKPFSKK
ncbi:MAG: V-type ATP synthase subunit I [Bacteroidaceae bacterium]|nr:V-type ATP synthase subunit I [Bacteroidaceae bacterium]